MKNEYTIQSDGTIEIKLTQGIVCIIDANDMELIAPYKWCAAYNDFKKSYYVVGRVNGKITRMHRLITGILEPNILVDHKDGNTLNNRRDNLRAANKSQNAMNRRATIKSKTGVKNISWSERDKKYYLHINHKHYGVFDTIEDAKVKRDKILSVVHGEFENRD